MSIKARGAQSHEDKDWSSAVGAQSVSQGREDWKICSLNGDKQKIGENNGSVREGTVENEKGCVMSSRFSTPV